MKLGAALATAFASAWLSGCQPPPPTNQGKARKIESCDYVLQPSASGLVKVSVECHSRGAVSFRLAQRSLGKSLRDATVGPRGALRSEGGKLTYAIDVADLARRSGDMDLAEQVGASFVAPISSVLVLPQPLTLDIPVTVRVQAEPGVKVSVGLARAEAADTYRLMAHELPVATYFAFGKLEQRELRVGDARLDVTRLDGAMDQSFDELSAWIAASAGAVRDFYGVFPVARASITVIPRAERDAVVFGKVLPESAPGIALVVGQHASRKALYSDWILVHELFHLGFPSFFQEGKWLDEGLATYYEPIIRVRAGLYTERELWQELAESMPQGLPAFTERGLEHANDFRGIYWGGALACFVADVEARKRQRERGLEVGLRAVQAAGGNACEVWSLADTIALIDQSLGAPTLWPIARDHGGQGQPFDFDALLRDLGVLRGADGQVTLSDQAPLATIRRAITAQP